MKQTIIYLRTSTAEQTPENQLKDCKALVNRLSLSDYEVISDKQSAWKDNVEREGFEKVKKAIQSKEVKSLVCWDLDRLYRNRKRLIEFFEFCKVYNCKIFSVRQDWLQSLNKIQEPFNEIMHSLMLQIMGWLSEEESSKKSERVKLAIKKKEGKTYSKFGRRWGRKPLSKNVIEKVLSLHKEGRSIREISRAVTYWDKNNNKRNLSIGGVHKIIRRFHKS